MLTHLEFEQVKRAIDRLRSEGGGRYDAGPVKREDIIDLLTPYVEGFAPPNPHPPKDPLPQPPEKTA